MSLNEPRRWKTFNVLEFVDCILMARLHVNRRNTETCSFGSLINHQSNISESFLLKEDLEYYKILDPGGSTVRYEMMKLFTGSV